MKVNQKATVYIFFFTLAFSFFISFFVEGTSFSIKYINATFYLSLSLFTLGGFLLIAESGFFNVTKYAFRKVFKSKKQQVIEESEGETQSKDDILYANPDFSLTQPILFNGISLTVICLVLSFIFFT